MWRRFVCSTIYYKLILQTNLCAPRINLVTYQKLQSEDSDHIYEDYKLNTKFTTNALP